MLPVKDLSLGAVSRIAAFALGAVVVSSLAASDARLAAQQPAAAVPAPVHFGTWGVDLTAMDRTVNPGDDFFRYVNGAWLAKTEIPADQTSTGVSVDVFNRSQDEIRAIIEHAPKTSQLGGMYQSFMDEALVEKLDAKPLQADLKRVAAIADKTAFTRFMGETNGEFGSTLFGPGVASDPANPSINALWLGQSGLGLPDRDYYLAPTFKPQLDAYRAYVERTFTLIGYPSPAAAADTILAFETSVAKASWPAADRRDIDKINNPMTLAELQTYAPGLDWSAYFAASSITVPGKIIVNEKTAVRDLAAEGDEAMSRRTPEQWEAAQASTMAAIRRSRFSGRRLPMRWAVSVAAVLLLFAVAIPLQRSAAVRGAAQAASDLSAQDQADDALLRDVARLSRGDDGSSWGALAPEPDPGTHSEEERL